jgi:hypothetical protein
LHEGDKYIQILVGTSEEKRSLGKPRLRGEHNIKMDIRELGFGVLIKLIWLRIITSGGLL